MPQTGCSRLSAILTSRVGQLSQFIQHRFEDEEMEGRFDEERMRRLLPFLHKVSWLYLAVSVLWYLLPRAGLQWKVWLFFRLNMSTSALGYIVTAMTLQRKRQSRAYYDGIVFFWGCHFLAVNSLTRSHTERLLAVQVTEAAYDEGYQLLVCFTWVAAFMSFAEVDNRFFIAMLIWNVVVWVACGLLFGVTINFSLFMKLTLVYFIGTVFVFLHARRQGNNMRQMLVLRTQLEKQSQQDRRMAQAEREGVLAKVTAAEQAAVVSFMSAVFDIYGHLEWKTCNEIDEPRLCFEMAPNAALDAFLSTSADGKPIEAILGPVPTRHGPSRDRWYRERRRLWQYADLEAHRKNQEDQTKTEADIVAARKIGLTCQDAAEGTTTEVELLIRPISSERVLFGILMMKRPETQYFQAHELGQVSSSLLNKVQHTATAGTSQSGSTSEDVMPIEISSFGEVSVLVNVADPRLEVLKCSAGFTRLSGPARTGMKLMDLIIDEMPFSQWLQRCVNEYFWGEGDEEGSSEQPPQSRPTDEIANTVQVNIRALPAKSCIEFSAVCEVVLDASTAQPDDDDRLPVFLVFKEITQKRRETSARRRQAISRAFYGERPRDTTVVTAI